MVKILLGGSPCVFWSVAKHGRETTPCGNGWELFKNFLIAKEKFQPDFFPVRKQREHCGTCSRKDHGRAGRQTAAIEFGAGVGAKQTEIVLAQLW